MNSSINKEIIMMGGERTIVLKAGLEGDKDRDIQ